MGSVNNVTEVYFCVAKNSDEQSILKPMRKKKCFSKYRIQAVVRTGLKASFSGIDDSTWHKTNLRNALGIMDTTV